MRAYITTANYFKLHNTFLCFENKYGHTGKTVGKTGRAASKDAIRSGAAIKHTVPSWVLKD